MPRRHSNRHTVMEEDMPATVRATQAAALHLDGQVIGVKEGQPFPDDDPIVAAHPWLFATDADRDEELGFVEQATASPGERRRR